MSDFSVFLFVGITQWNDSNDDKNKFVVFGDTSFNTKSLSEHVDDKNKVRPKDTMHEEQIVWSRVM